VSFSDVIDNLDIALMGIIEARKGRYGIFSELFYVGISADAAWALNVAYPINVCSGIRVTYINTRTPESTGLDSDAMAVSLSLLW